MAATGLRRVAAFGLLLLATLLRADQSAEMRSQLRYVGDALTAGTATDAMSPFSKSFKEYDTLSNYFDALTKAFSIVNEIDVLSEQDSANETKATIRWAITLSDLGTENTEHRSAEIAVRLVREKKKWKMVDFTPIGIFNPASVSPTKQPH